MGPNTLRKVGAIVYFPIDEPLGEVHLLLFERQMGTILVLAPREHVELLLCRAERQEFYQSLPQIFFCVAFYIFL